MTNHLCQQNTAGEIRVPELITHVDRLMEKHGGEKAFCIVGAEFLVTVIGSEWNYGNGEGHRRHSMTVSKSVLPAC